MSGFLYRQQIRNSIDHAAILRGISYLHGLMNFPEPKAVHACAVVLQTTVLALDERYFQLFRVRHDLISASLGPDLRQDFLNFLAAFRRD
jgi:hypothetical protein